MGQINPAKGWALTGGRNVHHRRGCRTETHRFRASYLPRCLRSQVLPCALAPVRRPSLLVMGMGLGNVKGNSWKYACRAMCLRSAKFGPAIRPVDRTSEAGNALMPTLLPASGGKAISRFAGGNFGLQRVERFLPLLDALAPRIAFVRQLLLDRSALFIGACLQMPVERVVGPRSASCRCSGW